MPIVTVIILVWVIVLMIIIKSIIKKGDYRENTYTNQELNRYKTLDEVRRKFKEMSDSGEVNYFSMDDVDRIIDELKNRD